MSPTSHWLSPPVSVPIGNDEREQAYRCLVRPFNCWWDYKGHRRAISAPTGLISDGMSIPRWLRSVVGIVVSGMSDPAAWAHDILYATEGGTKIESMRGCIVSCVGLPITRAEADWVLCAFLRSAGYTAYRSRLAWFGVRVGGASHWGGPVPEVD